MTSSLAQRRSRGGSKLSQIGDAPHSSPPGYTHFTFAALRPLDALKPCTFMFDVKVGRCGG